MNVQKQLQTTGFKPLPKEPLWVLKRQNDAVFAVCFASLSVVMFLAWLGVFLLLSRYAFNMVARAPELLKVFLGG